MSVAPNSAVLVVDDVAENRDLLVRRLKRLGIQDVERAGNGIEALASRSAVSISCCSTS